MEKFTIVQFSDMHAASLFPSSKAFVSSIISDVCRQKGENPKISKPNIMVVCGDVVEGVNKENNMGEASAEIRKQYRKAESVLNLLCQKLFCGNKNNIVIVPGNHDISWLHSRNSMEKIESHGNLAKLVRIPNSNYRWDWDDYSYYTISDFELYNRRFELFSEFYSSFYDGTRDYSLNPQEQFDIFEYPEENILVVGFNSCFNNDHLNHMGSINPDCMANCYEEINQSEFDDWLKIAIWHHDIQGNPWRSDFMDSRTLQFLIDKGFQIGLHGHTHQSDIFEVRFNVDETLKMNVFGCGSLGAQRERIPLGGSRQYALLELDTSNKKVRFNLRKALDQPPELPIWMPGNIVQNRDKSYIDGTLCGTIRKGKPMTDNLLKKLSEADVLVSKKEYSAALEKLILLDKSQPLVRRLIIECYWQLDKDQELIETIGKPTSLIEFTYLTDALWKEKDIQSLKEIVREARKDKKIASSAVFERIIKKMDDAKYG